MKKILFFTLFCTFFALETSQAQCPSDHAQLRDWYNNNNGASWNVNWNTPPQSINDVNMTGWEGISKNASGCVIWIGLNNKNIKGAIPNFNLPSLTALNLSDNLLSGTIPNFNLPNLENLYLGANKLSGSIPNFNLSNLKDFRIYENQLSGNIPNFNLPKLQHLYLYNNQLDGNIPNFSLPSLNKLWLSNNSLSGNIPNFNLPNLDGLYLSTNKLTGDIPNFNLPNLVDLHIFDNKLTGSIPNFNLSNLSILLLHQNQLSGTIPNFNLPKLYFLSLHQNQLSGSIPDFSNLKNLTRIYLQNNNLESCFINNNNKICSLGFSTSIFTDGYNFTQNPKLPWQGDFQRFCNGEAQIGAICDDGFATTDNDKIDANCTCKGVVNKNSCASLDSLQLIILYNATNGANWTNKWDLTKPMSTWYGISLNAQGCVQYIDLDGGSVFYGNEKDYPPSNNLVGTIPNLNLPNLKTLILDTNLGLTGTLPSLPNCTQLEIYNIAGTSISGTIPLFTQSSLKYIGICCNQLTGSIPNQIALNCPNLLGFYAQNNKDVSGNLPPTFGSLTKLSDFRANNCNLSGCFPSTYNNLCGKPNVSFSSNPLLPLKGDFVEYCKSKISIGAACDDGNPNTINDVIDATCLCKGQLKIDTGSCRYKDSLQLLTLYKATKGQNWTPINLNGKTIPWDTMKPITTWYGITLNANGCVSCVDLDGNSIECGGWGVGKGVGITSPFPTAICQLSELEILSLRGNQMKSKIPDSIQYLKKLIRFYVDSCNLQGPIPDAFWTLENLVDVSLNYNNFNTELSPKIGNLKKLRGFGISDSKMKGTIPKEIGDCTTLNYFYARNNQFSGTIPQEVTKLELQSLVLYNNEIDSVSDMSKADFKNFGYTSWGNGGVEISGNKLTFNDILPNMIFAQKGNGFVFNYAPQDSCGKYQSLTYTEGQNLLVDVGIDYGITSNTYQWYKGNDILTSQTNRQLKINNLQLSDAGNYYCKIENPNAKDLKLHRRLIKIKVLCSNLLKPIIAAQTTSFCQGKDVQITASTWKNYIWSTGATTQSITTGQTGTYYITVSNDVVCSYYDTIVVTSKLNANKQLNVTICEGEKYTLGASNYTQAGTYTAIFSAANACDSVVTLMLKVNKKVQTNMKQTICEGKSYTIAGKTYTKTGVYSVLLKTAQSCDSTVTLDLSVKTKITTQKTETICDGTSFIFDNQTLKKEGFYNKTYTSAQGCDSTFTLDLKLLKKTDLQLSDDVYILKEVLKAITLSPSPIQNDVLKTNNATLQLITQPKNGKVSISAAFATQNTVFTYQSINSDTAKQFFLYKVCSNQCSTICDTAQVVLRTELPKDTIPDLACIENSENKFPDLLTPNNDDANDLFDTGGILKSNGCTEIDLEGVHLHILNRWGERVYVGDILKGWDGRNRNGEELPHGAYYYSIVFGKRKPLTGVINLLH